MIKLKERLICPIKINITLRVLLPEPNGYHELYSVFWKKRGTEGLTISINDNENIGDALEVKGIRINGPNLVTKTLNWARTKGANIPWLHLELEKHFPVRSGIGAGSGNAAELLSWLGKNYKFFLDSKSIAQIGADVSFFTLGCDVALAEGMGEKLTPLEDIRGLIWVLAFPKWKSGTSEAYLKLDKYREAHGISVSREGLKSEAAEILSRLRNKEHVGLLPNDFLDPLCAEHNEYEKAFKSAEKAGALGWGLCGSGSAFFAICKDKKTAGKVKSSYMQEGWIIKITELE